MLRRDWKEARAKCDEEGACRRCGRWPVESAHIIGRARDERVGHKAIVKRDSICPLCGDCHRAYDQHQLDLLPYLTVPEQTQAAWDAAGLINAVLRTTSSKDLTDLLRGER